MNLENNMSTDLKGRTALVTGSTRGLGRAIAIALAKEGADIIINGRSKVNVSNTVRDLHHDYEVATYGYVVDATNSQAIKNSSLFTCGPQFDILVNNVGNIEKFGRFEDLDDEAWFRMYELGFMSAVRFIRAALPFLKKSDQASIINIGSLSAHQPSGLNPHYGAAKAGIINLTKNLAQDFGRYGITVNSICPSTLAGGGWYQNIRDRAQRDDIKPEKAEKIMRREECAKSPLGKIGELDNVANLVCYLASDKARFLTGHCYNVDGGITRAV